MKLSIQTKCGTTRQYNVSKRVANFYEQQIKELREQLDNAITAENQQRERASLKFKAFAALVFSPIVRTEKVGKTCKQITFENGKQIRFNPKNCATMRFWN